MHSQTKYGYLVQCILNYNMDTILWLAWYVLNREVINYSCIPLKVFANAKMSLKRHQLKAASSEGGVNLRLKVQNMVFMTHITLVI